MSKAKSSAKSSKIDKSINKLKKSVKIVYAHSKNKPGIPSNFSNYFHVDTGIMNNPKHYFDYDQSTDDESRMGVLRINDRDDDDVFNVIF